MALFHHDANSVGSQALLQGPSFGVQRTPSATVGARPRQCQSTRWLMNCLTVVSLLKDTIRSCLVVSIVSKLMTTLDMIIARTNYAAANFAMRFIMQLLIAMYCISIFKPIWSVLEVCRIFYKIRTSLPSNRTALLFSLKSGTATALEACVRTALVTRLEIGDHIFPRPGLPPIRSFREKWQKWSLLCVLLTCSIPLLSLAFSDLDVPLLILFIPAILLSIHLTAGAAFRILPLLYPSTAEHEWQAYNWINSCHRYQYSRSKLTALAVCHMLKPWFRILPCYLPSRVQHMKLALWACMFDIGLFVLVLLAGSDSCSPESTELCWHTPSLLMNVLLASIGMIKVFKDLFKLLRDWQCGGQPGVLQNIPWLHDPIADGTVMDVWARSLPPIDFTQAFGFWEIYRAAMAAQS